jgi:hypothetical protein
LEAAGFLALAAARLSAGPRRGAAVLLVGSVSALALLARLAASSRVKKVFCELRITPRFGFELFVSSTYKRTGRPFTS